MRIPMTPEAKSALTFLRGELIALDSDRANLVREIERIEKKYGAAASAPAEQEVALSDQHAPMQQPLQPQSGERKPRRNAKGEPSDASLVAEAGAALASRFSQIELRGYLDLHHPERSAKMTNNDLSKQIYIIRRRGEFLREEIAMKGGMKTYKYNQSYPQNK